MTARVKKRTDTSTNRDSDKIIVRLPEGMRKHLAVVAARHGKSMNAEVVSALAWYFAELSIRDPIEPQERVSLFEQLKQLKANFDELSSDVRRIAKNRES
jgi:plasmid stability protein